MQQYSARSNSSARPSSSSLNRQQRDADMYDSSVDFDLSQPGAPRSITPSSSTSSHYSPQKAGRSEHDRPGSVSSNSSFSSRVTRVRDDEDEDADGDGLSSTVVVREDASAAHEDDDYADDFEEPSDDEEQQMLTELERTYTSSTIARTHSADRDRDRNDRPLSGSHPPVHTPAGTRPTSSTRLQSSASSPSSSSLSTASAPVPSIQSRVLALKERCLRQVSEQEFESIHSFISDKIRSNQELSKDELMSRFGREKQDVCFLVEQLTYLSTMLHTNTKTNNATANGTNRSNGGSSASRKR